MTEEPKIIEPTPEQFRRGAFVLDDVTDKQKSGTLITIGKAFRRVPVFETLGKQQVFSDAELKALRVYRHHADRADRSPLKDSTAMLMRTGGTGDGPSASLLQSILRTAEIEAAAGSLRDILRAVVVDDVTLSQWAIRTGGSIEVRDGRRTRIRPHAAHLVAARLDIQFAAKRVQAELDA